jgi:hypothetical protein
MHQLAHAMHGTGHAALQGARHRRRTDTLTNWLACNDIRTGLSAARNRRITSRID